jgi:hypothetical protein
MLGTPLYKTYLERLAKHDAIKLQHNIKKRQTIAMGLTRDNIHKALLDLTTRWATGVRVDVYELIFAIGITTGLRFREAASYTTMDDEPTALDDAKGVQLINYIKNNNDLSPPYLVKLKGFVAKRGKVITTPHWRPLLFSDLMKDYILEMFDEVRKVTFIQNKRYSNQMKTAILNLTKVNAVYTDLRSRYAKLTYEQYAKDEMSLQFWTHTVLGHSSVMDAAVHYS